MLLECRGLSKSYGSEVVLDRLNISEAEFKCLAMIGPSGGGKTTLLRLICGLAVPDSGSIAIDGKNIDYEEANLIKHRRAVGTVFQSYNLFPHLTAMENVLLPLEKVHGMSRSKAVETASLLFDRFRLLSHSAKFPAELSGGQQQRIAIIRAIAISPRFFLFDEPTSALDPEMTSEVLDLISELRSEGKDMIVATHNIGFARRVADRVVFVYEGGVIEEGDTEKVLSSPETPELESFLKKVLRY